MDKKDLLINSISEDDFKSNVKKIMKKVAKTKLQVMDPKLEEMQEVYKIIKKFIIDKKRKVYGGYALNKLLTNKDPNASIYEDDEMPDIDFYSPTPLKDLKELCDLIYTAGYKPVNGEEAQHNESYKIHVNYQTYCDITYMPNNIFHNIKFITIENMNFIHPHFMMVDYFRVFTDPLPSFRLLEKMFPRYKKLEKLYPLPSVKKTLQFEDLGKDFYKAQQALFDQLIEKDSIIFTGFYIYNYYLHVSQYNKHDNKYKYIQSPYLEVYSTNYIKNGLDLINFLKDNKLDNITYREHYPFFQFLGNYTVFYYNDGKEQIPILYLYSNNKRCIPYKLLPLLTFDDQQVIESDKKIKLGCFDHHILHALVTLIKLRVDKDNDLWTDITYKYITNIVQFKDYYNKKNNTDSLHEDNLFEQFVVECYGEVIDPRREAHLIRTKRIKDKKPVKYRYDPSENKPVSTFIFNNSSGNPINNEKNLKLTESNRNITIEDELNIDESNDESSQ